MSASPWNAFPQPYSSLISHLVNDRLLNVRAGYLTNCR